MEGSMAAMKQKYWYLAATIIGFTIIAIVYLLKIAGIAIILVYFAIIGLFGWILFKEMKKRRQSSSEASKQIKPAHLVVIGGVMLGFIMSQPESRSPADQACYEDWKQCHSNQQMVDNYKRWHEIRNECLAAAKERAKYGEPQFSSEPFAFYYPAIDYTKDGYADLVEKRAKYQNGFGATVNTNVVCAYDLNINKVIEISFPDQNW